MKSNDHSPKRYGITLRIALIVAISAAGLIALIATGQPRSLPAAPPPPPTASSEIDPASFRETASDPVADLLAEARKAWKGVKSYTCTFAAFERIGDKLTPESVCKMEAANEPFRVHLKYTGPRELMGQEVAYVAGKNGGKMRVRGAGLKGVVGFVTLPTDDPRALEHTRHRIEEAGIGSLIETIGRSSEIGRTIKTEVNVGAFKVDDRLCTRVDIIVRDDSKNARRLAPRCMIYFDRENHLPIRFEAWDSDRKEARLLESFTYTNLVLNPDIPDGVFAK